MLIKIQPDAAVCRYLFTAKSLYLFRVSQHPSSGVLKTVTAASGTGHTVKYKDKTFINILMYHHPLLSEVNKPTHTVSSFLLILVFYSMTCTGGCGYSF